VSSRRGPTATDRTHTHTHTQDRGGYLSPVVKFHNEIFARSFMPSLKSVLVGYGKEKGIQSITKVVYFLKVCLN